MATLSACRWYPSRRRNRVSSMKLAIPPPAEQKLSVCLDSSPCLIPDSDANRQSLGENHGKVEILFPSPICGSSCILKTCCLLFICFNSSISLLGVLTIVDLGIFRPLFPELEVLLRVGRGQLVRGLPIEAPSSSFVRPKLLKDLSSTFR